MKKFEESFCKKTHQIEIRFFSLYNLKDESNLENLLKIVNLFQLQNIQLVGSCFVEQKSALLTVSKEIDGSIEIDIKKTRNKLFSKKQIHEISIVFSGKWLNEIIRLIVKEDTTLFIVPVGEENIVSQVELLINDNEFSAITFRTDKYDHDEIISEIESILNGKNK